MRAMVSVERSPARRSALMRAQHAVPGDVPAGVVERLEAVHVEHGQRRRTSVPAGAVQLGADHRVEVAAVGQPGQRVGKSEVTLVGLGGDVVGAHGIVGRRMPYLLLWTAAYPVMSGRGGRALLAGAFRPASGWEAIRSRSVLGRRVVARRLETGGRRPVWPLVR